MTAADRAKGFGPDEMAFVDADGGRDLAAIEATGCPGPALLRAAAVGALPEAIGAPVHAHVRVCAICRQLTADLLELDTELDMLEDARIRQRIARGRRSRVLSMTSMQRAAALAAMVVVGVSTGLFYSLALNPGTIPAAPARSAFTVAPPNRSLLVADKLEPRIDVGALVWRGGGDRFSLDLANALKPYAENNFKAASATLGKLAAQYPDRAEPVLYLGICQLLMDRPVDAEKSLRRAAGMGGPTMEDARWYLAVAAYQNGRRSEAQQLLADVCRQNGARAAEACLAQQQAGESR